MLRGSELLVLALVLLPIVAVIGGAIWLTRRR
jgi:hypothetical protein